MKKTERKLPEAPAVPVNPAEREKIEEQLRRQARIMNLLWSVSLIVIGVGTFILSVTNIAGIELPDEEEVNDILDQIKETALQYMSEEDYDKLEEEMLSSLDDMIRNFSGSLQLPQGFELSPEDVKMLLRLKWILIIQGIYIYFYIRITFYRSIF